MDIMKLKNKKNKEIMLKFKQTYDAKELDEMIYQFEKDMTEINTNYFLKESENPFIYFVEYPKPDELINQLNINKEYRLIPVTCVINNMNYITSTILKKIRHKLCFEDTFHINCYLNTFCVTQTKENIEQELSTRIENITSLERCQYNPVWIINLYVVGDVTAINITNKKSNRVVKQV